jgi:hypothetical protein
LKCAATHRLRWLKSFGNSGRSWCICPICSMRAGSRTWATLLGRIRGEVSRLQARINGLTIFDHTTFGGRIGCALRNCSIVRSFSPEQSRVASANAEGMVSRADRRAVPAAEEPEDQRVPLPRLLVRNGCSATGTGSYQFRPFVAAFTLRWCVLVDIPCSSAYRVSSAVVCKPSFSMIADL